MTTATTPVSTDYVEITSGPLNQSICDALKYAFDEEEPGIVAFYGRRIVGGEIMHSVVVLRAQVIGLSYDDDTGHSVTIKAKILNHQDLDPIYRGTKTLTYNDEGTPGILDLTK